MNKLIYISLYIYPGVHYIFYMLKFTYSILPYILTYITSSLCFNTGFLYTFWETLYNLCIYISILMHMLRYIISYMFIHRILYTSWDILYPPYNYGYNYPLCVYMWKVYLMFVVFLIIFTFFSGGLSLSFTKI